MLMQRLLLLGTISLLLPAQGAAQSPELTQFVCRDRETVRAVARELQSNLEAGTRYMRSLVTQRDGADRPVCGIFIDVSAIPGGTVEVVLDLSSGQGRHFEIVPVSYMVDDELLTGYQLRAHVDG